MATSVSVDAGRGAAAASGPAGRASAAAAGPRMRPKEHGAYAVLALPAIAAFALAGPTQVGASTALAAVCGFLLHEPLLVMLGHRGGGAQRSATSAGFRGAALAAGLVLSGVTALVFAAPASRLVLLLCLALALLTGVLAIAGRHRSLAGQLWATAGLVLPSVVILLAGGASPQQGLAFAALWLVGFSATTAAVRSVVAAQKGHSRLWHDAILVPATSAALVGPLVGAPVTLAAVPMVAASWYLRVCPPPAKYLKRVGWGLVAATALSCILVIIMCDLSVFGAAIMGRS